MITCRRLYHVSCALNSLKKQGIKLTKMLNPKTQKQWYPSQMMEPSLPSMKGLAKTTNEPGKRGIRRVAMLNKMFMKQITDLMSTGTAAMDIVGRGIEISKVKITPDLQTVNVFWVCKGNSSDEDTETILNKRAGALRHQLSTLRVMGEVPYIAFVKDKQEAHLMDLDRRLAIADYGEDYTPSEVGHLLKTEFTLNTKLSSELKAKIKQLDQEIPPLEEPVPEMTHNVYGLDHSKIMNRLLAARKRSRDAWSRLDEDPVISYRVPPEAPSDKDVGNQRQELADFLIKRQILQNKLHKQLRSQEWQRDLNNNDDEEDTDEPVYDDDDYDDFFDQYEDEGFNNDKERNVP